MVKPGELFPSVSPDLQVTVVFWIWMFGLIAASNVAEIKNQFGAINPVVLYSLGFLGLGFIAFREASSFKQLKKVLGMDVIIPGFGILSFFTGLGIGMIIYTLFTRSILSVANSAMLTSVAQPFFNPYTASATGFTIGFAEVAGIIFIHTYVAVFEEAYKIGIYKNLSNGIHKQTRKIDFLPEINISIILGFSLFATLALWGVWHFFSWNGLTIASIFMSLAYGVIFLLGYLILAATNIVPVQEIANEDLAKLLSGVIIYPNIGSHLSWNTLVSEDGFGIGSPELIFAGVVIVVLSVAGMFVARRIWG